MNLSVYLARAGVGSRRSCDELVREGRVTVGGEVVTFPRLKIEEGDEVAVDGEPVSPRELRYVLVNKPRGVASTRSDPHADRVIVDLVANGRTLFPVGRLDVDTTGIIILTNDGVLANRLMHPRYGVPKTYAVRVRGKVGKRALAAIRQGVELEDGITAPAEVRLHKQSAKTALIELTIHEGRKRQAKRMLAAVGLPVEELHRRRYGPLTDKGLEIGASRELSGDEVDALRRAGEEADRRVGDEVEGEPVMLAAETPGERNERVLAEAKAAAAAPSAVALPEALPAPAEDDEADELAEEGDETERPTDAPDEARSDALDDAPTDAPAESEESLEPGTPGESAEADTAGGPAEPA